MWKQSVLIQSPVHVYCFILCMCDCSMQHGLSPNDPLYHLELTPSMSQTHKKLHLSNSLHTYTHLETTDKDLVCENPSGWWCLSKTSVGIIPVIYPISQRAAGGEVLLPAVRLLLLPEYLPSNQTLVWWLDKRASGCYSYRKLPFPVTPHLLLRAVFLFFCFSW